MDYKIHVEIILTSNSSAAESEIADCVNKELQQKKSVIPGSLIHCKDFHSELLKKNVMSIRISEASEINYNYHLEPENLKNIPVNNVDFIHHIYRLEEEDILSENLCNSGDGDSESISAANYCLLPHKLFDGIWENLVFEDSIKEKLLEYASTSMIFSQCKVDTRVICWNRVVLLYGPPGTGKTSLCKALAQKLSIRLKKNYEIAEFIEINSHSLFSKYFSESGKLVMKLFTKIREHLDYGKSLVCILIDEIESLTRARTACMNGAEPSDSIRVVNAILTQLDQIRQYPNVLVLTTSNLKNAIDMAFVDRADLQIYVGPPSWKAIYQIFVSCLEELIRVNIIECVKETSFLPPDCIEATNDVHVSYRLSIVAKSCEGLSGRILRKLPFLAYPEFSKGIRSMDNYIEALQGAINQHLSRNIDIHNFHH